MILEQVISQNRGCARFVAWAMLIAGLLFSARVVYDLRLALTGKTTDGVVTLVGERTSHNVTSRRKGESDASYRERSRGGVSHDLTVRFTPEGGEPVEIKTTSTFGLEWKEGDAVKVIYRAADPQNAGIYSAKQLWLPLCVGFIVSFGCLAFGSVLMLMMRYAPK